jgi:hypothetical protein
MPMNMAYSICVLVFGFDANEEDEIVFAVEELGFDRISGDDNDIVMASNGNMEVGPSTAAFAEAIAHSIWLTNGSYCDVQVSVVSFASRNSVDHEWFYYHEDEFAHFLEEQERIDKLSGQAPTNTFARLKDGSLRSEECE